MPHDQGSSRDAFIRQAGGDFSEVGLRDAGLISGLDPALQRVVDANPEMGPFLTAPSGGGGSGGFNFGLESLIDLAIGATSGSVDIGAINRALGIDEAISDATGDLSRSVAGIEDSFKETASGIEDTLRSIPDRAGSLIEGLSDIPGSIQDFDILNPFGGVNFDEIPFFTGVPSHIGGFGEDIRRDIRELGGDVSEEFAGIEDTIREAPSGIEDAIRGTGVLDILGQGLGDAFGANQAQATSDALASQLDFGEQALAELEASQLAAQGFLSPFTGFGEGLLGGQDALFQPTVADSVRRGNVNDLLNFGGRQTLGIAGINPNSRQILSDTRLLPATDLLSRERGDVASGIRLGQLSAGQQGATNLQTGASLSDLLQNIGNTQAAGTIGGANAQVAGTQNVTDLAGVLAGLFAGGG